MPESTPVTKFRVAKFRVKGEWVLPGPAGFSDTTVIRTH